MSGVGIQVDPTPQGLRSVRKSILPWSVNEAVLNYLASRPPELLSHPLPLASGRPWQALGARGLDRPIITSHHFGARAK